MLEIVRMGLERREQIAAIWADAFEPDPMMKWVFPDDAARRESLRHWWGFLLDRLPSGAELHGTRADGCVAYWQPPRTQQGYCGSHRHRERSRVAYWQPPRTQQARPAGQDGDSGGQSDWQAEFVAMMTGLLGDLAPSRLEALAKMHQARLAESHWYLSVLGTSPDQQSKGLGGKVLAPMLERCDRIGALAYLESTNPANVGFYRRHGFEPIEEFYLADGVLITPMSRQPRSPED